MDEKIKSPVQDIRAVRVKLQNLTGNFRKVNGICNGPISPGADLTEYYKKLKIPYIRFHDTGGDVARYYIDVSRVFPQYDLNELDPESYCFEYSDIYVKAAVETGADIIYRLGESVDNTGINKNARPPKYFKKWAKICVQIIKHYNEGWADGYNFGIKYWEIWNEPDLYAPDGSNRMWADGTPEQAYELYEAAATAIKEYDSSLFVGGMSFSTYNPVAEGFISFCAEQELALDFLSFHYYGDNPDGIVYIANAFSEKLRAVGYDKTKLILDEWNYIGLERPCEVPVWDIIENSGNRYPELCAELFGRVYGMTGAAFDAAAMIRMNDAGVYAGCYYDGQPGVMRWCGLFDRFGNRQKPYYSFSAIAELADSGQCVGCDIRGTGIYAAAALSGKIYNIIVVSYRGGAAELFVEGLPTDRVYQAEMFILDGTKNLESTGKITVTSARFRMSLDMGKYAVTLIKIF